MSDSVDLDEVAGGSRARRTATAALRAVANRGGTAGVDTVWTEGKVIDYIINLIDSKIDPADPFSQQSACGLLEHGERASPVPGDGQGRSVRAVVASSASALRPVDALDTPVH